MKILESKRSKIIAAIVGLAIVAFIIYKVKGSKTAETTLTPEEDVAKAKASATATQKAATTSAVNKPATPAAPVVAKYKITAGNQITSQISPVKSVTVKEGDILTGGILNPDGSLTSTAKSSAGDMVTITISKGRFIKV